MNKLDYVLNSVRRVFTTALVADRKSDLEDVKILIGGVEVSFSWRLFTPDDVDGSMEVTSLVIFVVCRLAEYEAMKAVNDMDEYQA